MAGAHGVDVIALHGQQIAANIIRRDGPPTLRAEIMAVNALEHNALSVQAHQAIFQFKAAEAHVLPDDLAALPLLVIHSNPKLIQAWPSFTCNEMSFKTPLPSKLFFTWFISKRTLPSGLLF